MRRHLRRGQVLPLIALSLVVFFGFAALAVDAGYLEYKQRLQQTAADAAAIAGGWALLQGGSVSDAAVASAKVNGFTDGSNNVKVVGVNPPADGPNSGNASAVEVTITAKYPALFSAIIGASQNPVKTRAVAIAQNNPAGPCIYAMSGDVSINSGSIAGPCGILASKDVQDNSASISVPSIGAEGHVTTSPSGVAVSQGIPPFPDPCPGVPGCKALTAMFPYGSSPGLGPFTSCATVTPVSGSLSPGCYPGVTDGGSFDLSPGLYVFQGDVGKNGVSFTCTSCVAGSSGVTLVIGGKGNFNGSSMNLVAPPAVQGAGTATVSPNGGAPGVLIYQTTSTTSPENFSAQSLIGMIYAPGAHINLNGGGSSLSITYVVAADIVANKSVILIPNSGGENPSQVPVLAE